MKFWILIIGGSLLEVVGDFFLKKENFSLGLAIYFLGSYFWAICLKESELSRSIVLFTIVNLLAAIGIGILYFQETLTLKQWIGVGCAIASILLI